MNKNIPNTQHKCFWLWDPMKDPRDCKANGVDCPYKRQIWEHCRYGKIKQDSFEQDNKDKDNLAERITNKIVERGLVDNINFKRKALKETIRGEL